MVRHPLDDYEDFDFEYFEAIDWRLNKRPYAHLRWAYLMSLDVWTESEVAEANQLKELFNESLT